MNRIIIVIYLLLVSIYGYSQTETFSVRGIIRDVTNQKLSGANIVLLEKGTSHIVRGIATTDGTFIIKNVPTGEYLLKISFIGFEDVEKTLSIKNEDVNHIEIIMNEDRVELSEVVITAKNIEMFADRSTYRLSENDRNSFSNALTVLNIIPKLQINDLSLSTMDGKAVKILINGINSDETDLSVISTNDISRIEYYENPPIRFASAGLGAVVNLITKKKNYGGIIGVNLQNAPFKSYGNDVVSFKYNYNNSQIGLKYNINYRDAKERLLDETIKYQFENINYKKEKRGVSGLYKFSEQLFEINFNNSKTDNYTFSSKFSIRNYKNKRNSKQTILQYRPIYIEKMGLSNDKDENISPSFDLYFSKVFNSKHEFLVNLVGTYYDTEYNYDYSETNDTQVDFKTSTNIEGNKYSVIGDALYAYKLNKNKFTIGLRYFHGSSKHDINISKHTSSVNDELVAYGEMTGAINKLSYTLSAGIDHSKFNSNTINKSYNFTYFKPMVSLSYTLNKNSDINFLYKTNTINPTLAELSPTMYLLDYKYAYSGNSELKPYNQHDLQMGYFYSAKSLIFGSFISYTYANNPILPFFKMDEDFIFETLDNLTNSKQYKWGANFQWLPFPSNILRIRMYAELYHSSNSFVDTNWKYNGYRINPSLILNYKKWNLMTAYLSNTKILSGQRLTESPSLAMIELSYRPIQNLTTTLAVRYPFYNSWKKSSETHPSALVNLYETEKIKDMTNMVYLRFVYNFSFGKKSGEINKKLENQDIDRGVLTRP